MAEWHTLAVAAAAVSRSATLATYPTALAAAMVTEAGGRPVGGGEAARAPPAAGKLRQVRRAYLDRSDVWLFFLFICFVSFFPSSPPPSPPPSRPLFPLLPPPPTSFLLLCPPPPHHHLLPLLFSPLLPLSLPPPRLLLLTSSPPPRYSGDGGWRPVGFS